MEEFGELREVEVENVLVSDNNFLIILKEAREPQRVIPISIGVFEANGILMALEGITTRRPFTYDIFKTILVGSGLKAEKLIINELKEDIFFGLLFLDDGNKTVRYDIRPSDGIALALRFGCMIYVAEQVFQTLEKERQSEKITPLRDIHEDDEEVGITESDTELDEGEEEEMEKLEADLKKAIYEERYEDAAKIRDEIEKLLGR